MTRETFQVVYRPPRGPRRRVRYRPLPDEHAWKRETAVWTGCTWRPTGSERVTELDVTMPATANAPGHSCHGP